MHPTAQHVTAALATLGVAGPVRELPEPAPTAVTAAAQFGCEVGAIANSLVFAADVVWAAAGHAHTVFPTTFAELLRITGGTPADIGAPAS